MTSLSEATETGDYTKANQFLESIKGFQKKFGSKVLPSEDKINAEITYNKYDIFRNLFWMYMVAGLFMLVIVIARIFKENNITKLLVKTSAGIIIILFILHTLGLIARWYISGHAPWSDAYESMIYVAWATMFFGLAFGRKSSLTIASTAFVTSMILMIAHWNWMDPSIANLQPVLDSYWLMIHVSVIVGSYGPFTLGMILGAVALLLMIFTTEKNKKKMDLNIKEITIITEMALTVGLVMLTIGNFLGGQWANESWGRYWGWDPKETWALISIMVYAFVIHMRLVPGLRSRWFFNLMAVVSFASILMTYFGVNFYLAGLHSYASGDKVITPTFIYYSVAAVAVLGAVSYWRFQKFYAKKPKKKIEK
jgi:cytochrome c-type biogenesis protein CcsB